MVVQRCPLLTQVDLSHCDLVSEAGIAAVCQSCQQLQVLNLEGCQVTDTAVRAVARACPQLTSFNVASNPSLSDAAFSAIARSRLCSQLQHLTANATSLTTTGVRALARGCSSLLHLSVAGCTIADAALQAIARGCRHLTSLNVANCPQLSDRALEAVVANCPLKSLDVTGCSKLSDATVMAVRNTCHTLEHFEWVHSVISVEDLPDCYKGYRWWIDGPGLGLQCTCCIRAAREAKNPEMMLSLYMECVSW